MQLASVQSSVLFLINNPVYILCTLYIAKNDTHKNCKTNKSYVQVLGRMIVSIFGYNMKPTRNVRIIKFSKNINNHTFRQVLINLIFFQEKKLLNFKILIFFYFMPMTSFLDTLLVMGALLKVFMELVVSKRFYHAWEHISQSSQSQLRILNKLHIKVKTTTRKMEKMERQFVS